ncbi:MAG: class I SAM-dependent methyltransferase [Candidatus Njordarchaeia archaeon]
MPSYADEIARLYSLGIWPQDPKTSQGKARYERAIGHFRHLLEHEWIRHLISSKETINILELCAGTGIGGIAFSKVLRDAGKKINLYLTDIREDSLKIAKEWGESELGFKIAIIRSDAQKVHQIDRVFDIILMYGFSAPHFNPWEMLKIFTAVSRVISKNGIFIMEEGDRIYSVFYQTGYQRIFPERVNKENADLSIHKGYNPVFGTFERAYIDLLKRTKPIIVPIYFWNLAELMAMLWLFFRDIDFMKHQESQTAGFIIAKEKRDLLHPEDLAEMPKVIKDLSK